MKLYEEIEATFPNGHLKLSARADQRNPDNLHAFPGGPKEDIYSPLRDVLLQAKKYYNNLVLEKEALVPMISPKILMQSSEKRRRDYQASEEVGEGKGKKEEAESSEWSKRIGHREMILYYVKTLQLAFVCNCNCNVTQ